jgi:uncharacterized membrane protein (DUF485 family)
MIHVMLLLMLNVLYFYISPFQSMCALPNMAVFCRSVISERYGDGSICSYYYWCHLCFYIPHTHTHAHAHAHAHAHTHTHTHTYFCGKIFIFWILLTSFLITFLSPGIVTSVNIHIPFSSSQIMMSVLLGIVLLGTC